MKTKLFTSALFKLLLAGSLAVNAQSWSLTGNAGTIPGTNFIGTTDDLDLEFRTDNEVRMTIDEFGKVIIPENPFGTSLRVEGMVDLAGGDISVDGSRFIFDFSSSIIFHNPVVGSDPMIQMFWDGTENPDRMVLAHSFDHQDWGLEYQDAGDKFHFRNSSGRKITIALNGGKLGLGKETPSYQLHLGSNSAAKPTSSTWTVPSDLRLKKDVTDFTDGLKVIQQIHPVWFSYTGEAGMPAGEHGVGAIAQELQKVAPYMVNEWTYTDEASGKETNYLDVDYHALLFMFINAFKEQEKSIQELQSEVQEKSEVGSNKLEIEGLKKEIEDLKSQIASIQSSIDAEHFDFRNTKSDLSRSAQEMSDGSVHVINPPESIPMKSGGDSEGVLLGQNIPNPFDNSTIIPFRIPNDCNNPWLVITESATGRIVKVIPLTCDESHATIEAGVLSCGSYSYSLQVNGKIIDTKRMELIK